MCQICRQVIETLAINIELLLQNLDTLANKKKLSELDRLIICYSLLGFSRLKIANVVKLRDQQIRDRLTNNIYPRIAELMCVDQEEIAGNWVKIINFLLNPFE
ncbi:MAG: hypothetical protein PUP93_30390, partial [Rhizonema sp. NSF051]|nr:hypothetical protein [Rhizonema sp. NSF051]